MDLRQADAMLARVVEFRVQVGWGSASAFEDLAEAERSTIVVLDEWREEAVDGLARALLRLRARKEFVDLGVLVPRG